MKATKAFFNILLSIVMLTAFSSCLHRSPEVQLIGAIEEANKDFPMDYGNGFAVESVEFDDATNQVVYNCSYDEDLFDFSNATQEQRDQMQRGLENELKQMTATNKDLKKAIKLMKECNSTFCFRYIGSESHTTTDFVIDINDL
jgi:predicted ribosome quality control (RQC) complex YloA/Tae2 family protein